MSAEEALRCGGARRWAIWRGRVVCGGGRGAGGSSGDRAADRAEAEIAFGRAAELVAELEALAGEHPLHERVAGLLCGAFRGRAPGRCAGGV